jgi:AcrR family transcriptional regulator
MPSTTTRGRDPGERLLDAAAELFDREGIRAVGIDRLIADAGVARASLYQHFGSKDSLVEAYLRRVDTTDRDRFAAATAALAEQPRERIRTVFTLAEASARRRRYRGCLYVNALTEFPRHTSGVRDVVEAHREWLLDELTVALRQAGVPESAAGELAASIQLLYDGALVGSKASRDAEPIRRAARLTDELVDRGLELVD